MSARARLNQRASFTRFEMPVPGYALKAQLCLQLAGKHTHLVADQAVVATIHICSSLRKFMGYFQCLRLFVFMSN